MSGIREEQWVQNPPCRCFCPPTQNKRQNFLCRDRSREQLNVWLDTAWEWSKKERGRPKKTLYTLWVAFLEFRDWNLKCGYIEKTLLFKSNLFFLTSVVLYSIRQWCSKESFGLSNNRDFLYPEEILSTSINIPPLFWGTQPYITYWNIRADDTEQTKPNAESSAVWIEK